MGLLCSPARLWDPAYVLCPGWRGRPCHRKCSRRGPPNLALHLDRPPSSDTWMKGEIKHPLDYGETVELNRSTIHCCGGGLLYLRIQLVVSSNSLGVRMFVSDATEAAQYALLWEDKTGTRWYTSTKRDVAEQEVCFSYTYMLSPKALYF